MKHFFRKSLTLAALLFAALQADAQVASRLPIPNPNGHVYYGSSVTEYNGYSLIGTEFRDRVHLFQNGNHKFEAVGPQFSGFGYAHSMTSNWIAVGAPKINQYTGRVYLSKSVNGQPQNNFNLIINAQLASQSDEYGRTIDMHNNWMVVGAPNTHNELHGGYIEVWQESGNSWVRTQKIKPSGLPGNADYGFSVAIRGDRMVVGAPGVKKVYIYKLVNNSWIQEQIYTPNAASWGQPQSDAWGNTIYGYRFGYDVDITDGLLIVGDPEARKAAILTRNGSIWQHTHTLLPPATAGPHNSDQFGYSVAIQFNRAVVGAPYPAQSGVRPNEGKVYLYTDGYQFKGHMYVGNHPSLSISALGYSVAIDSDNVLGGSPYTNNLSTNVASEGAAFRMPFWFVYQSGNLRAADDVENSENTDATISLYPNPATDVINISVAGKVETVTMTNTSGIEKALVVKDNQIMVSELPSGLYFMTITTENGVITEKVQVR